MSDEVILCGICGCRIGKGNYTIQHWMYMHSHIWLNFEEFERDHIVELIGQDG